MAKREFTRQVWVLEQEAPGAGWLMIYAGATQFAANNSLEYERSKGNRYGLRVVRYVPAKAKPAKRGKR